ncbi:hypothetical protein ZOSMA_20G00760 [Zostera marina]|uniref:Ribosomal RNA-processing protein 7 C-terminal domain-containing protein n=1 Tax=Zostera marina TaxID=29655 RepID=A0A0K9PKP5_ZOSMR|nr:hypothetical protein ZOSMA_20G00760 [Zostera marina]
MDVSIPQEEEKPRFSTKSNMKCNETSQKLQKQGKQKKSKVRKSKSDVNDVQSGTFSVKDVKKSLKRKNDSSLLDRKKKIKDSKIKTAVDGSTLISSLDEGPSKETKTKSKKMKGYKSEVVVSEKPGVVLVQDEKKISKRKNKSHLSVKKKKSTGSDIIEDVTQISSVDGDFSDEIKMQDGKKYPKRIDECNLPGRKKKLNERIIKKMAEDVAEISSVDNDTSCGMKKWLNAYHESRPGLKILHQRIDDFITDYEAQEEKASKEREAQAAEGGWTVVSHHKGRKKTTDSESGIAVGSVAQAAVINNMTKKKNKEIPLDFYRFQKRDARRSEFMMLQSKFEEDKKRIQQLRAARKFCPY